MTSFPDRPLSPPRRAAWMLDRMAPLDIREQTRDDLEELFQSEAKATSPSAAGRWYWKQVLKAFPHFAGEYLYWRLMMIRNYALIAFRNILKQKIFSLINILGFGVSLSLGLLVISILADFHREDRFNPDARRIYRVISTVEDKGAVSERATAPLPLRDELENLPGVERVVRLRNRLNEDARCEDIIVPVSGLYADKDFFDLFHFRLDKGNPASALSEPFTAVLTRNLAVKLFPKQDPIGRVLTIGELGDFRVTGLVEDLSPKPSHVRFELLASLSTLESLERSGKIKPIFVDWKDFNQSYVYLKLKDNASPESVQAALPGIVQRRAAFPNLRIGFSLQRLDKISPGIVLSNELSYAVPMALVYVLLGIAFVILAIAGFNYMNLSMAKALRRGREIGLRKVLGAGRSNLIAQFIGEAVVIALLSLVFAFMLLQFLKPLLLGLNPEFRTFFRLEGFDLDLLPAFILFAVLAGIIAGFFPALYLAKFVPAAVLKDPASADDRKRFPIRKGLIVVQFFLSFLFLTTTIIGLRQIRFLQKVDCGFHPSGILNVDLQGVALNTFKQSIAGHPGIRGISASSFVPATGVSWFDAAHIEGRIEPEDVSIFSIDDAYLDNLGLRLVSGRGFAADVRGESEIEVLVNETAARKYGGGTPNGVLGKTVTFENGTPLRVVGIVGDFLSQNFNGSVEPLFIRRAPGQYRYVNIKLDPSRIPETMSFLTARWKTIRPGLLFRAEFHEDQINASLAYFKAIFGVIGGIAFLAILISLLGLTGMVVFETEARIKELGIRRTLGASPMDIFLSLSRKFSRSLAGAAVAAIPVAWFINQMYLRTFVTRIKLGPGSLLSGTILILGIAALIIGLQAGRAVRTNPARSLRNE